MRGGVDTPGNEDDDGTIDTSVKATIYTFNAEDGPRKRITELDVPYNPRNNLPTLCIRQQKFNTSRFKALNSSLDLTHEQNRNLNMHQKELLNWHYKLGHCGFHQLKWMARMGKLPSKNAKKPVSYTHLTLPTIYSV